MASTADPGRPLAPEAGGDGDEIRRQAWLDALQAATLLAIAPHALGGVRVRAGAGPVRDRWLAALHGLLPDAAPWRRMPGHIGDDRLLGGLDLGATLSTGRPVVQRGLLAEADGGLVVVPMAERLGVGTAARLVAALDDGHVGFERDGAAARWPSRIAVLALDEGSADDGPPPTALLDRLAFDLDLRSLSLRDAREEAPGHQAVVRARERLPQVQISGRWTEALCAAALQFGVTSLRASLLAVRAARAAAAFRGSDEVAEEDALLAVLLVLVPRATRRPDPASDPAEEAAPADDEADPAAPDEAGDPGPSPDAGAAPPAPPDESITNEDTSLPDRLIEAVMATLPAGLLAALAQAQQRRVAQQAGRVGALATSARSGRPLGSTSGLPRGGARLNLVETLRAAAPWQPVRRRHLRGSPAPRLIVHADDLRIARLQQRAATATLFVVDASGSSALHRLSEAKGAVNLLLADCYVRRDQVAVIAFRGRQAELLLPPTRSLVRAKRSLAALPGGGGTPLAHGLEAALQLALQVRRGGATPVVVLLTDGRANINRQGDPGRPAAEADALAMARQLRANGLRSLVIDTSPQPADAARRLADALDGHYRALPHAGAAALSDAVRALPSAPATR